MILLTGGVLMKADNELEQTLMVGMHGIPEVKRDEKIYFLGEFKERIMKKLTINQVSETAIYPEVFQVLKNVKETKMIINGNFDNLFTKKYRELAIKANKPCMVRSDSAFKGDTGLLIVSDKAVSEEEINVEEREIRLSRLGIPLLLIQAAGEKICESCFEKITKADENELLNYDELTWMDRLGGDRCPAHPEDE